MSVITNQHNPIYSLEKQAAILLAAHKELKAAYQEKAKGTKIHGIERRIRNRLSKEAGCPYNEALKLFSDLEREIRKGGAA